MMRMIHEFVNEENDSRESVNYENDSRICE